MAAAPVLAALDPVTQDLAPVRFAALVAGHTGAPLLVAAVYAADDVVERLAGGQLGEDLSADVSGAFAQARTVAAAAETLPLGATSAPRGLAFGAQEAGAALVVVGSPRATPDGRTSVGATAARLLNGAPCAVAVVPAGWDGGDWAVVGAGFVDSVEGRAAATAAHALAARAGARLDVLAVIQPRPWMTADDGDLDADLRARAEEAAADVAPSLGAAVNVEIRVGEPAAVLSAATSELDLLVCGARGYGPERAALLGGVTRTLTADAACPVIVLARPPGITLEALLG